MDDMPNVRFQSDIDGVRYMFCSGPDARLCQVRVWYDDGSTEQPQGRPGSAFVAYAGMRFDEPDEQCWLVDWGATRVEIEHADGGVRSFDLK